MCPSVNLSQNYAACQFHGHKVAISLMRQSRVCIPVTAVCRNLPSLVFQFRVR